MSDLSTTRPRRSGRRPARRRRDPERLHARQPLLRLLGDRRRPPAATSAGRAGSSCSPASLDILDGRVARMSQHRHPLRRRARLAGRRDLLRRGAGADHVLPGVRRRPGSSRWMLCFIYVVAAAVRLARFNVTAAGPTSRAWFTGLPSPAAGDDAGHATIPFSQTAWYQTFAGSTSTCSDQGLDLPDARAVGADGEHVKYPKLPADRLPVAGAGSSARSSSSASWSASIFAPADFLFPFGLGYLAVRHRRGAPGSSRAAETRPTDDRPTRQIASTCARSAGHDRREEPTRMTYRVHVRVMPRAGLLDPQGQAVEHALAALGFAGRRRRARRPGHRARPSTPPARDAAEARARQMCDRLLANPVTEDYQPWRWRR